MSDIISGSMGKGGGGGHTPVEAKDTLRSKQTVKVLMVVSEGVIESIDEVYLNKTPISKFTGKWDWRRGTLDQTIIDGFSNIENPLDSFTASSITKANGIYDMPPIPIDVDAVRVTFQLSSLKKYEDDGDLVGSKVQIRLRTKLTALGSYQTSKTTTRKGKASNPYAWDVLIERPVGATGSFWYLTIDRITADSNSVKLLNDTSVTNITCIRYDSRSYPGKALVGITLTNADEFGGQVPDIVFRGKGLRVLVPDNYDSINRTYSGNWTSLQFKPIEYFTTNPVWLIHYLLYIQSIGLGIANLINRASFYEAAKYADDLVPDGNGGTMKRFTIGLQIYERKGISEFFDDLCSLCHAKLVDDEFGLLSIFLDRGDLPVTKLVANANVVDGLFNYSSNDLEHRYTVNNVTYNNLSTFGETDTYTIPDTANSSVVVTADYTEGELQDRYGLQPVDLLLAGCPYKMQALYAARYSLYTNCISTKIISFAVGLEGLMYKIGEIVQVMDSDNAMSMQHFLILSSEYNAPNTTVYLDRTLTLNPETYTISFMANTDNTEIVEKTVIQSNGNFNSLSFIGAEVPLEGTVGHISGTIKPQLFQVTSIKEEKTEDSITYGIGAVQYVREKFDYIYGETTLVDSIGDYIDVSEFDIDPVYNIQVEPNASNDGLNSRIKLHINWDWNVGTSGYEALYRVIYSVDDQDTVIVDNIEGKSFDIDNAVPGTYEITVWAISPATRIPSTPVSIVYLYRTEGAASTLLPPLNARVTGTSGLIYTTPSLSLDFDYNPANADNTEDALRDYVIEVYNTSGSVLYRTIVVTPDENKNGRLLINYSENVAIFGTATRQYQLKVYSRDLLGDKSTPLSFTVNNVVPATVSFSLIQGVNSIYVSVSTPQEPDVVGYKVWKGSTANFVYNDSNEVFDGPDKTIVINPGDAGVYYYRVAAYDSFGKLYSELNVSGTQSAASLSTSAKEWLLDGIVFTPNSPSTNQLSYTSGSVIKIIDGVSTTYSISNNTITYSGSKLYIYYPGSGNTLLSTTVLATAVAANGYIIATYSGGTNFNFNDGKAFIDGSTILAGTVGANQLITGEAVITGSAQIDSAIINRTHIQDGEIVNAKIGDSIQSNTFDDIGPTYGGWKIDKNGNIITYGSLQAYDTSGNVIFASTGANWNTLLNKPTSLSNINSTEGTKLNGIANNATSNTTHVGSGSPGAGLGIPGDSYFDTSTGLMWQKTSTAWTKVIPQVNSSNASTFIADAAVGSAQIANLAVGTLKIQGQAVTVLKGFHLEDVLTIAQSTNTNASVSGTVVASIAMDAALSSTEIVPIILNFGCLIRLVPTDPLYYHLARAYVTLESDLLGVIYGPSAWCWGGTSAGSNQTNASSMIVDIAPNTIHTFTLKAVAYRTDYGAGNISYGTRYAANRFLNFTACKR